MNIKQCETFLRLVEEGSISKAALKMFFSKQGLSRAIQSLENELGVQLFLRTSSGITLSHDGERILPEMKQIVESSYSILKKCNVTDCNKLNILFPFGFFLCIPQNLIFDFIEKRPECQFCYGCSNDMEIEEMLLDGDYDLAFCSNSKKNENLNYIHLFRNYRCFLIPKDMVSPSKRFIEVSDLSGIKIAVSAPETYNDYAYLQTKFAEYGKVPDIFPCREGSTLVSFAGEKRGASFLISSLSKNLPHPDTRYIFFEDYISSAYDINIATKRGKQLSLMAIQFIKHCQNYCQDILKQRPNFPMD